MREPVRVLFDTEYRVLSRMKERVIAGERGVDLAWVAGVLTGRADPGSIRRAAVVIAHLRRDRLVVWDRGCWALTTNGWVATGDPPGGYD